MTMNQLNLKTTLGELTLTINPQIDEDPQVNATAQSNLRKMVRKGNMYSGMTVQRKMYKLKEVLLDPKGELKDLADKGAVIHSISMV